jgi:hypothetical protein
MVNENKKISLKQFETDALEIRSATFTIYQWRSQPWAIAQ